MAKTTIKERIAKLIDLKSILTLLLVSTLIFLVTFFAMKNNALDEKLFNLFSNIVTMVVTYFFVRKTNPTEQEEKKTDE